MLLELLLPRINEYMTTAVITTLYPQPGGAFVIGTKFLDLSIDLSSSVPHDCPPVSHYRLVLRERLWLRRLGVKPGDEIDVGAMLALFSTKPDDVLDGKPVRAARIAVAGIVYQADLWGETPA